MQFYNATLFKDQPEQIASNLIRIDGIYEPDVFGHAGDDISKRINLPGDEATVKAKVASCKHSMIWFNIENWPLGPNDICDPNVPGMGGSTLEWNGSESQTQITLDRWKQVIAWAREVAPKGTKFGAYGCFPGSYRQNYMYPRSLTIGPKPDCYIAYRLCHDLDPNIGLLNTGLADVIDFWCASYYPGDTTSPACTPDQFLRHVQNGHWLAQTTGKPWIPFLWANYWKSHGKTHTIPVAKWLHNKGIIPGIWGGEGQTWDPKGDWLELIHA